jgi:hypothetical protein
MWFENCIKNKVNIFIFCIMETNINKHFRLTDFLIEFIIKFRKLNLAI